ncbi:hypothetical protein [Neobacillus sp. FSL H8-0543]|uniref:hypothetical protein n=1 Tax=Neobacillus sp. FSL H8-0543 TaxID=2954672 RepID=UPI00315852CD
MDVKAKVKLLVQQVVEAYLQEQLKSKNQSIAILLGYQSSNPLEVLEAITPLLDAYEATLLLTSEWLPVPPQLDGKSYVLLEETEQRDLVSIIENTSVLVVPSASYRLLSKLALTIDDELAVWFAIQYQMLGKPIVIANNNIELTVYQLIHATHTVKERIQSYIKQILTDRVSWVPLSKLSKNVEQQMIAYEEKKALILEKHIEKAHRDGLTEIFVPLKSQVTPAAKDLARDMKIQIKQSSKGG